MIEGHLKGVTRTPQRKIFVIKDPHINPSLVIMKSTEFFDKANGDLFIGRELPDKETLIELIQEHQS
ncbi:MAG: hypothetical protein ACFFC6_01070 [Promethearchaeota archaeon]